jgi:hypothetical protein
MPQTDDPTPEQIRKLCEKIQATWTDEERRKRAGESIEEFTLVLDRRYRIRGTHVAQSDVTTGDW